MKAIIFAGFVVGLLATPAFAGVPDSSTIVVKGVFDGGGKTYNQWICYEAVDNIPPAFLIKDGGEIKNVVLGALSGDGIQCEGTCKITNVVWLDVCESAATLLPGGKSMTITGGSAANAADVVFKHNAGDGTVTVNNFTTTGSIGRLVRSCGNCSNNGLRKHIVINGAKLEKVMGSVVGVNSNFLDTASVRNVQIKGYKPGSPKVCVTYKGVRTNAMTATMIGEEWNTAACNVSKSDVKAY